MTIVADAEALRKQLHRRRAGQQQHDAVDRIVERDDECAGVASHAPGRDTFDDNLQFEALQLSNHVCVVPAVAVYRLHALVNGWEIHPENCFHVGRRLAAAAVPHLPTETSNRARSMSRTSKVWRSYGFEPGGRSVISGRCSWSG